MGRALFAVEPDLGTLAALTFSFDVAGQAPPAIELLVADRRPEAAEPARLAVAELLSYLIALADKLDRGTVLLRLDGASDEEIRWLASLAFRPASAAETGGLPAGTYWRQDPR